MNLYFKKSLFVFCFLCTLSCSAPVGNENTSVSIKTTLGEIRIKLYDETPRHRDNFIRLINSGFYDGISFHRIIKNFMIQAGDPAIKSASKKHIPFLPNSIISIFIKKERLLLPARVMR
jgi:hypothetical protein